jgi:predicted amidohydrolase
MKLCVVQTRPRKGDIQTNIANHKKLIELALSNRANLVIFPELSITGYEPELAKDLAVHPDDHRFDDFQTIADARTVTIGVGAPTRNRDGICISMLIFQPQQRRQTYSKRYIHSDEEPFFVRGQDSAGFIGSQGNIALAICYELSVPEHSENAFKHRAEIYVASVAKSAAGVDNAVQTLCGIARKYSMTVLMSNCVGPSSGFEAAGRSSIWNRQGLLLGQLNDRNEGLLIIDYKPRPKHSKTVTE